MIQAWRAHGEPDGNRLRVTMAMVARMLLQSEVSSPRLRFGIELLRLAIDAAPISAISRVLRTWAAVLHSRGVVDSSAGVGTVPSLALCHGALGSSEALHSAAVILLALVAHVRPHLFDRFCRLS